MKRIALLALFAVLTISTAVHLFPEPALAVDGDSDGLDSQIENLFGTSDANNDTDGDGLLDGIEVWDLGLDPTLTDTDGDGLWDDVDPDGLDAGTHEGGNNSPTRSWSQNLDPAAATGSTPTEGMYVNAMTGQLEIPLVVVDFGPGFRERNQLVLLHRTGMPLNDRWGKGIVSSWDHWVEELVSDNVYVYFMGSRHLFTEDSGSYIRPDGFPFTLSKNAGAGTFTLTAIRGGKKWVFDATNGWLDSVADRFGNTTTIHRDGSGVITSVDLPEGNTVELTTHSSGRYHEITDWTEGRVWELTYNYFDELARCTSPRGATTQFFYVNGSGGALDGNLVRIKLGGGHDFLKIEYDAADRVKKQTAAGHSATFTYTSISTTILDFAGNQRTWNKSVGAIVPTSLVQYSDRDVRTSDPASWTTTFAHNSDLLLTKTVFPEGNRLDQDWDSDFCLTERRKKATDTDTDAGADLVWTFTYGSTYNELEDSTDPEGHTTERTLDGLEFVEEIEHPTITHPDPDVTIVETFDRNSNGQLVEHVDGEGVKTLYEYISSGVKKGLLERKTVDHGIGKLNLEHEYAWTNERFLDNETDPDGYAWQHLYDADGNRTWTTSPSPLSAAV